MVFQIFLYLFQYLFFALIIIYVMYTENPEWRSIRKSTTFFLNLKIRKLACGVTGRQKKYVYFFSNSFFTSVITDFLYNVLQ